MNNNYLKILSDLNRALNEKEVRTMKKKNITNTQNSITTTKFEPGNNVVVSRRGNLKNYYRFDTFKDTMLQMQGRDPFTRQLITRKGLSFGRVPGGNGIRKKRQKNDSDIIMMIGNGGEAVYNDKGRVVKLDLSQTELKILSKEIGKLQHLEELDLSENELTTLPKEIGNLTKLKSLTLSANKLTSTSFPTEIGQLKNLEELLLDENKLTSLPMIIFKLTKLTSLYPSENKLKTLPKEIGNLTQLQHLGLTNNKLTSLPKEIGKLTKLEELNLRNNKLTSLPKEIGKLTKLIELNLTNNKLTSMPIEIYELIENIRNRNLRA